MEAKHEFMISNPRLAIDLCLSMLGVLFFGAHGLYFIFGVAKVVFAAFGSDIWLEAVAHIGIAIMGAIFILLFLFMTLFFIKMIRINYHLFSLTISVSDDGIEMTSKTGKYLISRSDILHLFYYKTGVTLVWNHGDAPITFHVRNNHFGNKTIKEMAGLLSRFEGYTEDKNQIKRIRKSFRFDHIFRKNRYEYQLCKQTAE
jgi:membrane-bound ClpP family serine protease